MRKSRGLKRDFMRSEKKSGGKDVGERERALSAKALLQSLSELTEEKWTWGQSFSQPHPASGCVSHKCDLRRPTCFLQNFPANPTLSEEKYRISPSDYKLSIISRIRNILSGFGYTDNTW